MAVYSQSAIREQNMILEIKEDLVARRRCSVTEAGGGDRQAEVNLLEKHS